MRDEIRDKRDETWEKRWKSSDMKDMRNEIREKREVRNESRKSIAESGEGNAKGVRMITRPRSR